VSEKSPVNEEKLLGVDKYLLVKFLNLIQDKYPKADKAHFFLQTRAELPNIHGVANLRDVLSHLTSFLDENEPPETKTAHIDNAAEHFRRAILEPYESALNRLTINFNQLYEKYREFVLPVMREHEILRNAPDKETVEDRLGQIKELSLKGRDAKRLNVWNDDWEEGVTCFITAYDNLSYLFSEIEQYWNNYQKLDKEKELVFYKNQLGKLKIYIIWFSVGIVLVIALIAFILLRKIL
jgi:hypothetical protein